MLGDCLVLPFSNLLDNVVLSVLLGVNIDCIDVATVFRNAWTNSRYVRKAAAQYSWVPAWRTKDLNPRA